MTVMEGPIGTASETAPVSRWVTVHDWATTTDHKKLGIMYIGAALCFFGLGGLEASKEYNHHEGSSDSNHPAKDGH